MNVKEMFEIQKKLQKEMFSAKLPQENLEGFKYSMLALVSEIGEVLEADKRWKNARAGGLNRDEKLMELVDCMAFVINAVLYSGFEYDAFERAFKEKSEYNLHRIKK